MNETTEQIRRLRAPLRGHHIATLGVTRDAARDYLRRTAITALTAWGPKKTPAYGVAVSYAKDALTLTRWAF